MCCFAGLEAICQAEAPLAPRTWYELGGPARWLLTPRTEQELREVLARCRQHGVEWRVLGRGANVLVRDAGFGGAVIMLSGPPWDEIRWEPAGACAGAGVDFHLLAKQAAARGLGGLENLAGIPGSLGGIVRMNAGGKYGEIGQYVRSVRVMDETGAVCELDRAAVGFEYRKTQLGRRIVLGATLVLQPGSPEELTARFQAIWKEKYATQPPVSGRTAGCIFKNPRREQPAGRLLDQCGLKGTRRGGAEISTRHANFIVAHAGATAGDVIDLIEFARRQVRERAGVELELEVEIW